MQGYSEPLLASSPGEKATAQNLAASHGTFDRSPILRSGTTNDTVLLSEAGAMAIVDEQRAKQRAVRQIILRDAVKEALFCLACLPFIGTIFVGVALKERGHRRFLLNPSDWMVLMWIGFCSQMSIMAPILNATSPDARTMLADVLKSNEDYLGPFIVFPATCLYLCSTAVAYVIYKTVGRLDYVDQMQTQDVRSAVAPLSRRQKQQQRDLLENIQVIKMHIQDETVLPTWVCIPLSLATGFAQMMSLRICVWSSWAISGEPCTSTVTFMLPHFNSVFYHFGTSFWLLTFTAITALIYLALVSYYQQLLAIKRFAYYTRDRQTKAQQQQLRASAGSPSSSSFAGRGSLSSPRSPRAGSPLQNDPRRQQANKLDKTTDIFSPKNLSLWISVWTELLRDLRERPAMQAVILTSVVSTVICGFSTAAYVMFDNVVEGQQAAEFTSGCIAVLIFCVFALAGFVLVTAKLQYVVDYQIKSVSETQTAVQHQLEDEMMNEQHTMMMMMTMEREHEESRYRMLQAKVNVLQALDTVLRTSESRPKLVGLSLETIRWTVIVIGLLLMNVAFFVLYWKNCVKSSPLSR